MRYLLEIIIAVLAVYGGYTALHELAALLKKWISAETSEENEKERSEQPLERDDKRKGRRPHHPRRHD